MIELDLDIALALALLAPAGVIGWAALFSVLGIEKGPQWSQSHLNSALRVLALLTVLCVVAAFVVRPFWAILAAAYPVVTGALLAWGRIRQLAVVQRSGGFTDIGADFRRRLAARLSRGLIFAAVLAALVGVVLVVSSYWQGWIMMGLAATIAWALSLSYDLDRP